MQRKEYNSTAKNTLKAAMGLTALTFVLPILDVDVVGSLFIYDILTPLGMGFIAISIGLFYKGHEVAGQGKTIKRWAFGGLLLNLLPIVAISATREDFNAYGLGIVVTSFSLGYYTLLLGQLGAVIAGISASNEAEKEFYRNNPMQQPGYQQEPPQYGSQPQQPQYGSQPQQPQYGSQPQQPQYGSQPQQPQGQDGGETSPSSTPVAFCPECGTKAVGRFCNNCGTKLE